MIKRNKLGQFVKGELPWNTGKKFSGMTGKKHSKNTKKKLSNSHKGKIFTKEHRKNMSLAQKGKRHKPMSEKTRKKLRKVWFKKGHQQLNTGKTHFKKGQFTGNKNYNWKGGKSFEPYSLDWTEILRRSIRERDNYICQLCEKLQGDMTHNVHHIDYDKKNCNPINLITLCHSCNAKVNHNREYWTNYFIKHISDTTLPLNRE